MIAHDEPPKLEGTVGMCNPFVVAAAHGDVGGHALARTRSASNKDHPPKSASRLSSASRPNRVVDLTHRLTPEFPRFPGVTPLKFEVVATVERDGWYEGILTVDEHTGTHIDAPAHFAANGDTVEKLPADRLVAPMAIIRIADRAASDPDALLTVDDLITWECRHGRLPAGAFVAMDSGWDRRATEPPAFLNQDDAGVMHYPGFDPNAAAFLVDERDVVGIGVDTLSLDHGPSRDFPTHLIVLPAGKYGVEALANLSDLPPVGATIVIGALTHVGGSGSPVRALALV